MTASEFLGWAGTLLRRERGCVPLADAFPETLPLARDFDLGLATVSRGTAVILACKAADDVGYAQAFSLLHRVVELIPKPGRVDALGTYGLLVLVFEKPLDLVKRDRLAAMRVRKWNWWRPRLAQIAVVELLSKRLTVATPPAGLGWLLGRRSEFWPLNEALLRVPKLAVPLLESLAEAAARRGEPPPPPPADVVGQRERHTAVAAASLALIALLAAVHVLVFLGRPEDSLLLRLYRAGARSPGAIEDGEVWRFLTANFLHFSWDHLVGNVISLFEYARGVEALWGPWWLAAGFVGTGIAANLFSWSLVPGPLAAGASASVCGLGGMLAGVYAFRRDRLTLRFRTNFFGAAILASVYVIVVRGLFFGRGIDNLGHLGGVLSGFLLGVVLPLDRTGPMRAAGRALGLASVAASLVAGGAVLGRWDAGAQPFLPLKDDETRTALERPAGFRAFRPEDGALEVANGAGARVAIKRQAGSMDWLFAAGDAVRQKAFEEGLPKEAAGRLTLLGVQETRLGVLRAVSARYEQAGGAGFSVEDLYVPQREGGLFIQVVHPTRDGEYYRPLLEHLKASFVSLAPPPEGLAQ